MVTQRTLTNSAKNDKSRYTQGGTTDQFDNRLGWWEREVIVSAPDDIIYTVDSSENARPDLIAFRLYQQAGLAWLVMQFNHIVDPATELATGKVIRLPTPTRVALTITTATL